MLIALRQREQDIVRFLILLGPTIGAYLLLFEKYTPCETGKSPDSLFLIGTFAVEFVLAVGACYCVALGYNYRCIELQLKKFERALSIDSFVLRLWQQPDFKCRVFCIPPEIIKVFWISFLLAFVGVGVSALTIYNELSVLVGVAFGVSSALLSIAPPLYYARKVCRIIEKES